MKLKKGVKRIIVIVIVLILLVSIGVGGYFVYKAVNKNKDVISKPEIVEQINNYGYELEKDANEVYEKLFKELQDVLNEEEVNDEEYAKILAQMMAVDFYNLENKMSKNDVGGSQFVYKSYRKNFVLEASETVYKYIEHNLYGDRKQSLPEVVDSSVSKISKVKYSYGKIKDDNAYSVTVKLSYKKDMGYPTSVVVKLLHNEEKLEVYYMK